MGETDEKVGELEAAVEAQEAWRCNLDPTSESTPRFLQTLMGCEKIITVAFQLTLKKQPGCFFVVSCAAYALR